MNFSHRSHLLSSLEEIFVILQNKITIVCFILSCLVYNTTLDIKVGQDLSFSSQRSKVFFFFRLSCEYILHSVSLACVDLGTGSNSLDWIFES